MTAGSSLETVEKMIVTVDSIGYEVEEDLLNELPSNHVDNVLGKASLSVTASYEHLENLIGCLDSAFPLFYQDSPLVAFAVGNVSAELDMMFYLDDSGQSEILDKKIGFRVRERSCFCNHYREFRPGGQSLDKSFGSTSGP